VRFSHRGDACQQRADVEAFSKRWDDKGERFQRINPSRTAMFGEAP